ncbi:MAG: PASTA domain-containing protein, partial [Flavobacteriales bacterium]
WGVIKFLEIYTMHGQSLTVPDFKGYPVEKIDSVAKAHNMRFVITDSIHHDKAKKGAVIKQDPEAGSEVKKNRKIYMTINARSVQKIRIPELNDLTIRLAISKLKFKDIGIKKVKLRNDPCVGCVLAEVYKNDTLKKGDRIKKGEDVTLVLGKGKEGENVLIPKLIGVTIKESKYRLWSNGLNVESIHYNEGCCETEKDSMNAKVYRQVPKFKKEEKQTIKRGKKFELWVTRDKEKIKKAKKAIKDTSEKRLGTDSLSNKE